jgi:hypothetical protein
MRGAVPVAAAGPSYAYVVVIRRIFGIQACLGLSIEPVSLNRIIYERRQKMEKQAEALVKQLLEKRRG